MSELAAQCADRGGQVAVAQLGRAGARHHRADLLLRVLDQLPDPLLLRRVGVLRVGVGEQRAGRGQRLGDRVVQLRGQLAAGGLLGRDQAGQQLEDAGAGLLGGTPGLLGHLVGDPGPQVQRVEHPGQLGELGGRADQPRGADRDPQRGVAQSADRVGVQLAHAGGDPAGPQDGQRDQQQTDQQPGAEGEVFEPVQPAAGQHGPDEHHHRDDRRRTADGGPGRERQVTAASDHGPTASSSRPVVVHSGSVRAEPVEVRAGRATASLASAIAPSSEATARSTE